jgi:2-C-methyl-D-erythritol 4-phosphate cytidylyltransferase
MPKTYAIIPAAGRGLRMGKDKPKQFLEISGKPLLVHTLEAVSRAHFLSGVFLVVPKDFVGSVKELVLDSFGSALPVHVIAGGAERQDSVYQGLRALPLDCGWVMIHDGVRPFVSQQLMEAAWEKAQKTGAAIAALPSTDTVKRVVDERVVETLPRSEMWLVQTPQVFRLDVILRAYEQARADGGLVTDDASLVERTGVSIAVAPGEPTNVKVTTPNDLIWAEWFMREYGERSQGQ